MILRVLMVHRNIRLKEIESINFQVTGKRFLMYRLTDTSTLLYPNI